MTRKNRIQFIDKVKVFLKAGNGGNGCVSFRREKHLPKGGPNGGNGGNGGNILFMASNQEKSLIKYKLAPHIKAESAKHGQGSSKHAKNSPDKICLLPLGTQIFDEKHNVLLADLDKPNMEFLAVKGGKGGYGNEHYKTSVDQAPTHAQPGQPGEIKTYCLQLKILADIGIIGMPNAGKSSLLRSISNATPEVANYPFTTINPQLGTVLHNNDTLVFADIPGLIEFASAGKGLGHAFLAHIERCNILLHLIDINLDIEHTYKMVRQELYQYSPKLTEKEEIIVLSKIDYLPPEQIQEKLTQIQKLLPNKVIMTISNASKTGIKELLNECFKTYKKLGY